MMTDGIVLDGYPTHSAKPAGRTRPPWGSFRLEGWHAPRPHQGLQQSMILTQRAADDLSDEASTPAPGPAANITQQAGAGPPRVSSVDDITPKPATDPHRPAKPL
jgi:hypothetical protein